MLIFYLRPPSVLSPLISVQMSFRYRCMIFVVVGCVRIFRRFDNRHIRILKTKILKQKAEATEWRTIRLNMHEPKETNLTALITLQNRFPFARTHIRACERANIYDDDTRTNQCANHPETCQ